MVSVIIMVLKRLYDISNIMKNIVLKNNAKVAKQ